MLGSLLLMTAGMYVASTVGSVLLLLAVRFITGLGIGGMLAATNAMVAEYSNAKRRSFNVALMATGYPVGIIIGGSIASALLAHFDWRSVFVLGAVMSAALFPLVWFLMPESIAYLAQRRGPDALQKINTSLGNMGHPLLEELPRADVGATTNGWRDLFSADLIKTTIILTVTYLAHIMTFYYILKWIPKLVVDMQFHPSEAGGVLVWANVGGALGSVLLGALSQKFKVRHLVLVAFAGSFIMINVFGLGYTSLASLALVAAVAGFFTNSAIVGLYALFAEHYPTHLRAGGTGFVIGLGRAGAVLGPIIAGFLFDNGFGLSVVSLVMALGSLIALFALLMLNDKGAHA